MRFKANNVPIPLKNLLLVRFRQSSITDNLRGEYYTFLAVKYKHLYFTIYNISFPLKLSVTEDGLTAEIGLAIKSFKWKWHIIYAMSYHELPPYRRKENKLLK